jgi:hyperosmotically inducible protein
MKKLAGLVSAAALVVSVGCGQTDAGITTAVKSKLAADDMVKAYQVEVETENKVVTLRGDVETAAQKDHAVLIARNTDGVTDVIDQLRVNPTAATSGLGDVDVDRSGDADVDVDVDDDLRRGAEAVGDGVRRGAEEVKEGAEKAGDAIRDSVTDRDRDSDKDVR